LVLHLLGITQRAGAPPDRAAWLRSSKDHPLSGPPHHSALKRFRGTGSYSHGASAFGRRQAGTAMTAPVDHSCGSTYGTLREPGAFSCTAWSRRSYLPVVETEACPAIFCTVARSTPASSRSPVQVRRRSWGAGGLIQPYARFLLMAKTAEPLRPCSWPCGSRIRHR
jgi:hypothetical protein